MVAIIKGRNSPLNDAVRMTPLVGWLLKRVAGKPYWAVTMLENRTLQPFVPPVEVTGGEIYRPRPERAAWAARLCKALNDQVHYNGLWTVWLVPEMSKIDEYGKPKDNERHVGMVWQDWDGDVQHAGTEDMPFERLVRVPIERFVENAATMLSEFFTVIEALDAKPEQQVRIAAGERHDPNTLIVPPGYGPTDGFV